MKLTNYAEVFGSLDHTEPCETAAHPHGLSWVQRHFSLGPELGGSSRGLHGGAPKGFLLSLFDPATGCAPQGRLRHRVHRLRKGRERRQVPAVLATVVPDTKSGHARRRRRQGQAGVIGWVRPHEAVGCRDPPYERLFTDPSLTPVVATLEFINLNSLRGAASSSPHGLAPRLTSAGS